MREHRIMLAAVILIQTAASLSMWLVPLVVGAAVDQLGLNSAQIGLLATADVTGVLIANALALAWIRQAPWRSISLPLLLVLIAINLVCASTGDFAVLYPLRVAAGLAAGSLMAIGSSILGASTHPDRNIALFTGVQLSVVAICFLFLPGQTQEDGLRPIYVLLAALALLSLPAWPFLPPRSPTANRDSSAPHTQGAVWQGLWPVVLAVLPVLLFHTGSSAAWAYIERIGFEAGLSPSRVGYALAAAMLGGISGSALAFLIGLRLGRLVPLVIVFGLQLVSLYLLLDPALLFAHYLTAVILLGLSFNAVLGFQFGLATRFQNGSRTAVTFLLTLQTGLLIGPMLAAYWVNAGNHRPALWLAGLFFLLSTVAAALLARSIQWRERKT